MRKLSNLNGIKKIYFIGIGGISLSALSVICKKNGFEVAGSDEKLSDITKSLERVGIKVFEGHNKKNIESFDPDLVVYSLAIRQDNPELVHAKNKGILIKERAIFVGEILKNYKNVISVAGTHGKTTTTSMISEVLMLANLNPTVHIGGESVNINSNVVVGDKNFFVNEACEYKKSFLNFKSKIGVILNIEEDHPDCYRNLSEIEKAFADFQKICKICVVNEKYKEKIFSKNKKNCLTFGLKNADFVAKNIKNKTATEFVFDVYKNNKFYEKFKLNIFGKHNILNALATICVCDELKIAKNIIKQALENFKGVKRRFERVETNKFCGEVYFDYAHHPTEIKKLISEAESLNKPIICVFQPHTYSRTKQYFSDFLNCFNNTYQTIFYKTYSARENRIKGASAKDLYKSLKKEKNVFYYNSFKKIIKHLKKYSKSNCLVLFVGAGDIYNIKSLLWCLFNKF